MNRFIYLIAGIAALTLSATVKAQNFSFTANVEARQETEATLDIVMSNSMPVRGFQFDLTVPEGLEPVIVNAGTTVHDFNVANVGDNRYRVLSYAMDNSPYPVNFGTIVRVSVTIPDGYTLGQHTFSVSDAYLSDTDNSKIADSGCSATLTVLPKFVVSEGIRLERTEITLLIGQQEMLTATVLPENTTDKTVTWSSWDESVATVSTEGIVTAIAVGSARITAANGNSTATCEVTVDYADATDIVAAEGSGPDDIFSEGLELHVGESKKVDFIVVPSTASQEIAFSSEDENIASVDRDGNITAVAEGSCRITVSCKNLQKTFMVKAVRLSQTISWSQELNDVVEGEAVELTAEASSGLEVEYAVIFGNASIDGATLTANGPGEIVVEARQGGSDIYRPAEPVRKSLNAVSGVDFVVTDGLNAGIKGDELVIGEGDYALYTLNGMLIRRGRGPARVALQPDRAYVLRIGDRTIRFMMR